MINKSNHRKEDILQGLATILESDNGLYRITTAKLARTLNLSEAALYRHFPGKAHMFDALIDYIEDNIQSRINSILLDEQEMSIRLKRILHLLLGFSEKIPG